MKGQFFSLSSRAVNTIIEQGGQVEDLLAYVVLSRGAGKFTSTCWTENAVSERCGFPYSRAQRALDFLRACGLIAHVCKAESEVTPPTKAKRSQIIAPSEGAFFLPNSLVDGVIQGEVERPIKRICSEVKIDLANGIDVSTARLDMICVLLAFYEGHNVFSFGGVDPRLWYRRWEAPYDDLAPITPLNGGSFSLCEIERCEPEASTRAVQTILWYVRNDAERAHRYWHAIKNILHARLALEVVNIWDAEPLQALEHNMCPEVIYPLHIFRQKATESEPYLSRNINSTTMALHGQEMFFDTDGTHKFGADVKSFRFIAPRNRPYCAGSVLRLRYRPHDRDTGAGIADIAAKSRAWTEFVESIRENLLAEQRAR